MPCRAVQWRALVHFASVPVLLQWRQMDVEYTLWQMANLLTSPKAVYRQTSYRKQTKNQWARDDPAFVVVLALLVALATVAYCLAFGHSLSRSLFTVLSAVGVDFLGTGAIIATGCWAVANAYLRRESADHSHAVEQKVEWMYAFDVHCNAFFPLFVALYVVQFFLTPLLLRQGYLPAILSCALYAAALGYYNYVNFLGYHQLPFLQKTELFLAPIWLVLAAVPFCVLAGFNPTRACMGWAFGGV